MSSDALQTGYISVQKILEIEAQRMKLIRNCSIKHYSSVRFSCMEMACNFLVVYFLILKKILPSCSETPVGNEYFS